MTVGAGTVENNGCAAVAVHNVKVVKGVNSTLSETIYDIQNEGGLLLDGLLGANPLILDDVLEDYGIQSTPVSAEELLNPGLYLIAYWNSPDTIFEGAHFVVIEFDGTNHRTYNGTNYHPSTYSDSYIYGYRIS